MWRQGKEPVRTERKNAKDETLKHQADKLAKEAAKVSLSEAAKQRVAEVPEAAETDASGEEEVMTDLNMRILKALFEKLTGRKFKMYTPPTAQPAASTAPVPAEGAPLAGRSEHSRLGGALRAPRNLP